MDELAKATFWDPAKNGGEGGYRRYPHSSDIAPISALPWDGGETSADLDADAPMLDVGAYPWAQSPWGLLDGSGGEVEWTEDAVPSLTDRVAHGTEQYQWGFETRDRVDWWDAGSPRTRSFGFRIATIVPNPPGVVLGVSAFAFCVQRTRRP